MNNEIEREIAQEKSNNIEQAKIAAEFYTRIANGEAREDVANEIECYFQGDWSVCSANNVGKPDAKYRWKPKAVKHPGGEYPEPCNDAEAILVNGGAFRPDFSISNGALSIFGRPYGVSKFQTALILAASGLYHLTEEAALQHARALFTPNDVDGDQ